MNADTSELNAWVKTCKVIGVTNEAEEAKRLAFYKKKSSNLFHKKQVLPSVFKKSKKELARESKKEQIDLESMKESESTKEDLKSNENGLNISKKRLDAYK